MTLMQKVFLYGSIGLAIEVGAYFLIIWRLNKFRRSYTVDPADLIAPELLRPQVPSITREEVTPCEVSNDVDGAGSKQALPFLPRSYRRLGSPPQVSAEPVRRRRPF